MQVVATEHSTHFFDVNEIPVKVYRDTDEWQVQVHLSLLISFPFIHLFLIFHLFSSKVVKFYSASMNGLPQVGEGEGRGAGRPREIQHILNVQISHLWEMVASQIFHIFFTLCFIKMQLYLSNFLCL